MEKIDTLKEMSNFVFASKYARYNEKAKRRKLGKRLFLEWKRCT